MIYVKFHCGAEISCSVNKQNLFIYSTLQYTTNLYIAMKLYINHLEYSKKVMTKILIFVYKYFKYSKWFM